MSRLNPYLSAADRARLAAERWWCARPGAIRCVVPVGETRCPGCRDAERLVGMGYETLDAEQRMNWDESMRELLYEKRMGLDRRWMR